MDLNIRDFPEKLAQEMRVEAAKNGVSLREYVIARLDFGDAAVEILDFDKGNNNGLGEVIGVGTSSGVQGVRGGVRDKTSDKGKSGGTGSRAVRGSLENASTNGGAVVKGVQHDSGGERFHEGTYIGPPHSKTCRCKTCRT